MFQCLSDWHAMAMAMGDVGSSGCSGSDMPRREWLDLDSKKMADDEERWYPGRGDDQVRVRKNEASRPGGGKGNWEEGRGGLSDESVRLQSPGPKGEVWVWGLTCQSESNKGTERKGGGVCACGLLLVYSQDGDGDGVWAYGRIS